MPCTDSRHSVPDAAKQPQNITNPPPCFMAGSFLSLGRFLFAPVNIEWMCLAKKLKFSLICPGYSPRNFVASHYMYWQISILLFSDFLSLVVYLVNAYEVQFGSKNNGWRDLTLMDLDLGDHL